jgi:hypothetical protein
MDLGTTGDLEKSRRVPVVEEFPKMVIRQRLTALIGFGLIGCLLLGGACDIINPELAHEMGGNPIPGSTRVNGFVLIVLHNLTPGGVSMSYEFDLKVPGQDDLLADGGNMGIGIPGYFAMSVPCGVKEIRLMGLSVSPLPDPDDPESGALDLPTTNFTSPLLECGSVIFVTVSGLPPNAIVDVQLLK